jgi:O-antigen ligase
LIGITGLIVTSFYWYQGSDPVNAPKLAVLGLGALAIFGILITNHQILFKFSSKAVLSGILVFLLGLVLPLLLSDSNTTQMIYGVYGRNTGLLAYIAFVVLFLASQLLQTSDQLIKVLKFLFFAVVFNQLISLLQILGFNPLRVNDLFGTIIGTFGNPNFISAFMGMAAIMVFAFSSTYKVFSKMWIFLILNSLVCVWLVTVSNSKQGLIIVVAGIMLIFLIALYHSTLNRNYLRLYSVILSLAIVLGVLGVTNKGPLASLIYESSIGFRMRYWIAGLEMFRSHFFYGVGLNSYGDWYRSARDAESIISPGLEVTANSAHNIYIDFAANGGILLIVGYFILALLVFKASFIAFRKSSSFDPILTTLFVGWFGYSMQGLVSIDQIGLTVWGWILGGLLIAYSKNILKNIDVNGATEQRLNKKAEAIPLPARSAIGMFVFALIGGLIYFQSFLVDVKWGSALRSGNPSDLVSAALSWPRDEYKIGNASYIFIQNNLDSQSLELAREGVKNFPRSTSLWRLIFQNKSASIEERKSALEMMIKLDPRNEELKRLLAFAGPNQ